MCSSFQDLFRAAMLRDWTSKEETEFKQLDQHGKNLAVHELCQLAKWICQDVTVEGVVYSSFYPGPVDAIESLVKVLGPPTLSKSKAIWNDVVLTWDDQLTISCRGQVAVFGHDDHHLIRDYIKGQIT